VNGEAIYGSRPWSIFREGEDVRFTRSGDGRNLYAIALKWPGRQMKLRSVHAIEGSSIQMLGVGGSLQWQQGVDGLTIDIPPRLEEHKPCQQAYVFRIRAHPYESHQPGAAG
jgi:alpha-L-fucosidase